MDQVSYPLTKRRKHFGPQFPDWPDYQQCKMSGSPKQKLRSKRKRNKCRTGKRFMPVADSSTWTIQKEPVSWFLPKKSFMLFIKRVFFFFFSQEVISQLTIVLQMQRWECALLSVVPGTGLQFITLISALVPTPILYSCWSWTQSTPPSQRLQP